MRHALGRNVEHDPRSRSFAHPAAKLVKKSTLWPHRAPVLDQGQVGSCPGNALAQWANTDFAVAARNRYLVAAGRTPRFLEESDALKLYSLATKLDNYPGSYPPDDTGSSGNAVCKAGRSLKLLGGWRWTFTFDAFLAALQTSPLIVGTTFFANMEDPDRNGYVEPTGAEEGGHEYLVLGVDYSLDDLIFLNSWSDQWGVSGRFRMKLEKFRTLLADQGDVTIPMPPIAVPA